MPQPNKLISEYFRGRNFSIKISVRYKKQSGESEYFMTNKDGYINLYYNPTKSFVITSGSGVDYVSVAFPLQDFYDFAEILESMYKAILLEDMYYLDDLNELVLNKELAKKYCRAVTAYKDVLVFRPTVNKIDQITREGIEIIVNQTISIPIDHKELKKLVKNMYKTDIHTLAATTSLAAHLVSLEEEILPNIRRNNR